MSRLTSLLVAGGVLGVSVALAALLISLAPEPTRTEQPPQTPFVQTGLVAAGSGPVPVFGSGTVRPGAQVDIVPQVGGKVVWVEPGFQSGGRITAGQTLFRLEDIDYRHRVREAEANVAASQVAYLQERERASIARAQHALYSSRQEDESPPNGANPLALREPQLKAAQAALDRDEARDFGPTPNLAIGESRGHGAVQRIRAGRIRGRGADRCRRPTRREGFRLGCGGNRGAPFRFRCRTHSGVVVAFGGRREPESRCARRRPVR